MGVTASGFTRSHFIHQTEGSAAYTWRLPATGQVVSAQMRYLLRHIKTETGKLPQMFISASSASPSDKSRRHRGREVSIALLIPKLALDGVGGQFHDPGALPPGESPSAYCTGDWLSLTAWLDGCGKSRLYRGSNPPACSEWLSRQL